MTNTSSQSLGQGRRQQLPNSAATSSISPLPPHPSQPHVLRKMASASSLGAPNSSSEKGPSPLSRPTSSSLSLEAPPATPPMTDSQVISLAKRSMRIAQTENESQINEAAAGGAEFTPAPGVTIDWSHRNIEHLPEEVVDIIKDGLERLALSHNRISEIPARFVEFTSLWYINVRDNRIKEFPLALCELRSLEIIDFGNNLLEVIPHEICKLTSLKSFSLRDNRITELPLCLADMVSLQRLKLKGNDGLVFPPKEILDEVGSPPREGSKDNDAAENEKAVTDRIKKYLRQYALEQAEAAAVDDASEGTETPRLPARRNVSGRFPVRVSGANLPDLRSPSNGRAPPIPSRSHFRGLSQQSTSVRRPGFMPLTMGSVSERVRSNSETLLRADGRSRRLAASSSARAPQLGTLDELQPNNNRLSSHYRGLSHGSAMQPARGTSSKSPNTPSDPYLQRPIYVRRLSVLPERRRESKVYDPTVETAKGILYSVFQIHPVIQMLMSLTSEGASRRSSLEIVFYNTNSHVEELEQAIQKHDPANHDDDDDDDEGGPASRDSEAVRRACRTLVGAYSHICTMLVDNMDAFVEKGDPRYIRTLLTQLWSSIMEIRVTVGTLGYGGPAANKEQSTVSAYSPPPQPRYLARSQPQSQASSIGSMLMMGSTIRARSRENSIAPSSVERSAGGLRPRPAPFHQPSALRVSTDMLGQMRNGSVISLTSATPRSGESFASTSSQMPSGDFAEEDRMFERVFLSLKKSSDIALRTLPGFNAQIATLVKREAAKRAADWPAVQRLEDVMRACRHSIGRTDALKKHMSDVKLNDPLVRRGQSAFWTASCAFLHAWIEAGTTIKYAARHNSRLPMPQDARLRLRPVQKAVKETMEVILESPWHWLVRRALNGDQDKAGHHVDARGSNVLSPPMPPLPMTPQSAALGPAMQATVPSTPSSAVFAPPLPPFHAGAFERAGSSDTFAPFDRLPMTRSATMTSVATSGTHSTLNSLSSFSSVSDNGSIGIMSTSPATMSMGGMSVGGMSMGGGVPPLARAATSRGVY